MLDRLSQSASGFLGGPSGTEMGIPAALLPHTVDSRVGDDPPSPGYHFFQTPQVDVVPGEISVPPSRRDKTVGDVVARQNIHVVTMGLDVSDAYNPMSFRRATIPA